MEGQARFGETSEYTMTAERGRTVPFLAPSVSARRDTWRWATALGSDRPVPVHCQVDDAGSWWRGENFGVVRIDVVCPYNGILVAEGIATRRNVWGQRG